VFNGKPVLRATSKDTVYYGEVCREEEEESIQARHRPTLPQTRQHAGLSSTPPSPPRKRENCPRVRAQAITFSAWASLRSLPWHALPSVQYSAHVTIILHI